MVVAMGIAKRGHKAGLDFDTRAGARAFAFVKSGMAIGLDAPISAGSGGSDIHPLDMALGGL
jgi:CRISPR/Cas system type I-B associated protein Csh2 (Cas7 group RAMP superfamily)